MSRRRLLELVRPSTRPVEWGPISFTAAFHECRWHRVAKSRSLLALLQSLTGVLSGLRHHQSVEPSVRRPAWFGNGKFFEHAKEVRFSFLSPENTGYKFSDYQ